jgi:hypothetical protein
MSTVAYQITGNGEEVYTFQESVAKTLCEENPDLEYKKILID